MNWGQYEQEVRLAATAAARAAVLCQAVRAELVVEAVAKSDESPVTIADYGAQAIIARMIAERFPDDPVIAEEDSHELRRPERAALLEEVSRRVNAAWPDPGGFGGADAVLAAIDRGASAQGGVRFWTIDPIDGTKGFLRGGQYAIAVALLSAGNVAVGALACPNLPVTPEADDIGVVFVAARGHGAWALPLNAIDALDAHTLAIHPSPHTDLRDARYTESVESRHSAQDESQLLANRLGIVKPPIRIDSQAKYALVARGESDIYIRMPTRKDYHEKIWDHAAGALLVEEAGGTVTDILGRPLEFQHGRELLANRGVLVTNGPFHLPVLTGIAAASA